MLETASEILKNIDFSGYWSYFGERLGDWKSIAIILSVLANIWLYLIRPIQPMGFLAGQWSGKLTDGEKCYLDCVAVFYREKGVLQGHFYYQGNDHLGNSVQGFDVLENDSSRFEAIRATNLSFFKNEFNIKLSRDIHIIAGEDKSEWISKLYPYKFSILRRFGNPRMSCKVSIQATNDGTGDVELHGQFSKLNGR